MSLRLQATRGLLWSATDLVVSHVVSLAIFVVLARLLVPEDFGLVAMAAAVIAAAQILLDQGFPDAIIQMRELESGHLDTAFWTNLGLALLLSLALLAGAGAVARAYGAPALVPVLKLLSPVFLLAALSSVQRALLRRRLEFRALAVRHFAAVITGGIVGVTMAVLGFGVFSLVAQTLSAAAAGAVALWWASGWRPGIAVSFAHLRDLASYGLNIVGVNLVGVVTKHADKALIGLLLGPTVLGYYYTAYRVIDIAARALSGIMNAVAFPAFSRIQDDPIALVRAFQKAVQTNALLALPAFVGVALMAHEIVGVLFGEQWAASGTVLQVLSFFGITYSVSVLNNSAMKAIGKPHWVLALAIAAGVTTALLVLTFVRWGLVAVAAAYVLRSYLLFPVSLVLVSRLMPLNLGAYVGLYRGPFLATLAMSGAVLSTRLFLAPYLATGMLLAAAAAVGAVTFGLMIWLLEPGYTRDAIGALRATVAARPKPHGVA